MQTKICASLESIANSQQTALQLLRRLVANNDDGDEDDILGAPVENENELQELERKLEDKNNRKKLVSYFDLCNFCAYFDVSNYYIEKLTKTPVV